jgi:hypothetical protein
MKFFAAQTSLVSLEQVTGVYFLTTCLLSYLFDVAAGRGADLPGLLGAGGHRRVLCDPPVGFPTSLMPQPAGAQTSLGSLERGVTGVYFVTPLLAFLPP